MRLDELLGVKKFNNMSQSQIGDYLKVFGGNLKLLGEGANAVAITDGTSVYKFWYNDSAYESYVKYVLENQNNPFVPKFKSSIKSIPAFFLREKGAPDRVKYIKMEMLSRAKSNIKIEKIFETMSKLANSHMSLPSLVNKLHPNLHINREDLNIMKTLEEVNQIKGSSNFDLHWGNVMQRSNNEYVLIDPLANKEDMILNEIFYKFDLRVKLGQKNIIGKAGVNANTREK